MIGNKTTDHAPLSGFKRLIRASRQYNATKQCFDIAAQVRHDTDLSTAGMYIQLTCTFAHCRHRRTYRAAGMVRASRCCLLRIYMPATDRSLSDLIACTGTVSCSDWSGCGPGLGGMSWDYQACTQVMIARNDDVCMTNHGF